MFMKIQRIKDSYGLLDSMYFGDLFYCNFLSEKEDKMFVVIGKYKITLKREKEKERMSLYKNGELLVYYNKPLNKIRYSKVK